MIQSGKVSRCHSRAVAAGHPRRLPPLPQVLQQAFGPVLVCGEGAVGQAAEHAGAHALAHVLRGRAVRAVCARVSTCHMQRRPAGGGQHGPESTPAARTLERRPGYDWLSLVSTLSSIDPSSTSTWQAGRQGRWRLSRRRLHQSCTSPAAPRPPCTRSIPRGAPAGQRAARAPAPPVPRAPPPPATAPPAEASR